jgi:hypothetical protein
LRTVIIDKDGAKVIFTVPQEEYLYDDYVMASDSDGNGIDDTYTITLKFNRDLIIAGFKDANGLLRIAKPTDLISTIIANGIRIGSDTNLVISPPEVKYGLGYRITRHSYYFPASATFSMAKW